VPPEAAVPRHTSLATGGSGSGRIGCRTCTVTMLMIWSKREILVRAGMSHAVEPSAVSALTRQLRPGDFPPVQTLFAEGKPSSEEALRAAEGRESH
jgi:hypothetical protein